MDHLRAVAGPIETAAALVALLLLFGVLSPIFFSPRNLLNILLHVSVIGVVSVGMTFVVLTGGIDLSVGSVVALSAVLAAKFVKMGVATELAGVCGLAVGAAVGVINGTLVVSGGIPPFIATLGTMGIARGLALILAGGRSIYGLPSSFLWMGQGRVGSVPLPALIFLAVVALGHFLLLHTRFGLHAKVVGDNETAARVTGVNVRRVRLTAYTLSGVLAALAGLMYMSRVNAAEPMAGTFYELDAIGSVVIGGTSLFGGVGTVLGTLVGTLIMGVLRNGLNILAVAPYYQQVAIGAAVILAVLGDRLRSSRT